MRHLRNSSAWIPSAVFLGGLCLFVSTLAPSVVFGDPSEYTFVPYVWGILHPSGYAFQTLLAKLWQTLIPIGTIAYRTNLLSAVAGAVTVTLVCGSVSRMTCQVSRADRLPSESDNPQPAICNWQFGVFAASLLASASDFWQHAIHANAHIVTATLAALSLFCLVRWRGSDNDRWLYAFAFAVGLSVTHHPLRPAAACSRPPRRKLRPASRAELRRGVDSRAVAFRAVV